MAHIPPLERSIEKTNKWVHEFDEALQLNNDEASFEVLKSLMQTLRDRLQPGEAAHLAAQIPATLRGFYYEGWNPDRHQVRIHSKEDFFRLAEERMGNRSEQVSPEQALEAFRSFLKKKISEGELKDIRANLPEDVAEWFH